MCAHRHDLAPGGLLDGLLRLGGIDVHDAGSARSLIHGAHPLVERVVLPLEAVLLLARAALARLHLSASSRAASATGVPPGPRTVNPGRPSARSWAASQPTSVVLPAPSGPSTTRNTPAPPPRPISPA